MDTIIQPLDHVQGKIFKQFNAAAYSGGQVIKYSTAVLFNFGWINPIGSVFSKWMALRTLAMCLITLFAALFRCKKNASKWEFCFPVLSSSEGLIFASLVSFLLGLFVSNTFARWWSVREKLALVMNNIQMCTMYVTHNMKTDDALIQNNRLKFIRLLNLGHAILYKQANGKNDMDDLLDQKLLCKEEEEVLQQMHNKSAIVSSWQFSTFETLASKMAPAPIINFTLTSLNAIFAATQDIFMLIDTQQPYAYLHLITTIVKIHLIFVVFYAAGMVAQGIDQFVWSRIMLGYATIIFNNIIYEGLLQIHDMLHNPLGHDQGDFPHHLYRHNTELLTRQIQTQPLPHIPMEELPTVESPKLSSHADLSPSSSQDVLLSPISSHKHRE